PVFNRTHYQRPTLHHVASTPLLMRLRNTCWICMESTQTRGSVSGISRVTVIVEGTRSWHKVCFISSPTPAITDCGGLLQLPQHTSSTGL
ncbi:MAG: hypothetical protein Q8R42_00305, partial [Desulfocapsaceae bacterium]|nr:hypothetical protein [Desulfocapsaceae bacterium]